MNPKPLSSLNHLTVPVAMCSLPGAYVLRNAGGAKATTTNAGTELPGRSPGTMHTSVGAGAARGVADPRRPWTAARRGGLRVGDRGRQGAESTDDRATAELLMGVGTSLAGPDAY